MRAYIHVMFYFMVAEIDIHLHFCKLPFATWILSLPLSNKLMLACIFQTPNGAFPFDFLIHT